MRGYGFIALSTVIIILGIAASVLGFVKETSQIESNRAVVEDLEIEKEKVKQLKRIADALEKLTKR